MHLPILPTQRTLDGGGRVQKSKGRCAAHPDRESAPARSRLEGLVHVKSDFSPEPEQ